ncbi:unnamed protein product [Linum trigynum]|uniref:Uncharacterized protein n=1 Tax=Linum trigynum TaxID=586398 RepID=A0AAV2GCW6_9ROSI
MMVLAEAGRLLERLPKNLAVAIQDGSISGSVVSRFLELKKSGMMWWLLQFNAFKKRFWRMICSWRWRSSGGPASEEADA